MSRPMITKAQFLAAFTALLIFLFDWKKLDVDPALISMMASFLAGITTLIINWAYEKAAANTESHTVKANDFLIAENKELKQLVDDQDAALGKAGIEFVKGEGVDV